ncbi:hypothetical protein JHK87_052652 [Glycine soja]|uniref:DUF7746 domain-containing protein n=1 Tax=Glycine max TaxID=3847 RepID=A0A0R0EUX7_SOYBN|nr:hypothetical protein JHK87_052652 [Glycine soja]
MRTRNTSKLINVIHDDNAQNLEQITKEGSIFEKVNAKHWKTPSKLYYQRLTALNLLLEERGESNFKSFSANNIYEWNIDAQTEYNIINMLQHMTMIPDVVNTLIFTIAQHFIGDPSLWKDRSGELLSNLKCRTLADFRWYRDTFLTRVYTREDRQQPFCLPKTKEKKTTKKGYQENKTFSKKSMKTKIVCYNYGKQGHISKYCRLKKKLRNLNLDPSIEEHINNMLIETSEEETEDVSSEENLNLIQQDDQPSSTDDEDKDIQEINTLTRDQDLLFEAINSIPDPQENKVFLNKLKKSLETKPKSREFITNNKFDVSNILKRLENTSAKPTTIQDLQT